MRKSFKSGFTVIELVIVVVVIGILAALVLVVYSNITNNARDKSIMSDSDSLDSLETQYAIKNNTGGLAWYSTLSGSTNSTLSFTPSSGNVIDVVTSTTDYCIRIYNPKSLTYKSLASAYIKESIAGICTTLTASSAALASQ
jgi:prepilin-type N-terminal cleavage/methylation domain-containing protein